MEHFKHAEGVNLSNIIRAAELIETIPYYQFDMGTCRSGQMVNPECDSVGCIIGHTTVLAPELLTYDYKDEIDFLRFSFAFFGLEWNARDWYYLFGGDWKSTDNTHIGASLRLRYYAAHGLPINWDDQMKGYAPLSYK